MYRDPLGPIITLRLDYCNGSCQKVGGSWQRLARRYGPRLASLECISGPGCRSTSC